MSLVSPFHPVWRFAFKSCNEPSASWPAMFCWPARPVLSPPVQPTDRSSPHSRQSKTTDQSFPRLAPFLTIINWITVLCRLPPPPLLPHRLWPCLYLYIIKLWVPLTYSDDVLDTNLAYRMLNLFLVGAVCVLHWLSFSKGCSFVHT